MKLIDPEVHTLSGAYACDALERQEAAAFEEHLSACAACVQQIAELRETAAALAAAVAAEPPVRLRAAVFARIAVTLQLPPTTTGVIAARNRRRSTTVLTGWAAAAALGGVVAGLSVHAVAKQQRIDTVNTQDSALFALLSAPDVHSGTGRVRTGGSVTVVDSRSRDEAAIALTGLAALPAGESYQLWMIGPGAIRSGGLLPTARHGTAAHVLAHGLGDTGTVALSVEPAHGSAQPSTNPILLLAMPS